MDRVELGPPPPHCPAALDKAVAWAAASARAAQAQNVPSATLSMLPRVGDAPPHMQLLGLNADVATHLGTIKGGKAAPCMHVLPAWWWAGGPAHRLCHSKEDVDLVLVWNAAARSDMGRHAAAVREAVRQHGPPELRATADTQEGACEQAEQWLGRLIMDTVRVAVGDMSGLRREYDIPGGPSQGASYATLPASMHGDDYLQLGSRAVRTWLGSLTGGDGDTEPCMSQVYGGGNWGHPALDTRAGKDR